MQMFINVLDIKKKERGRENVCVLIELHNTQLHAYILI